MLKQSWCLISLAALLCSITGFVIAQPPLHTPSEMFVMEYGDEIVTGVSGGAVAKVYLSRTYVGEECTGPTVACAPAPSPDCAGGICDANTAITVPTCVKARAWMGTYYCFQNGMECANGVCTDNSLCYSSVPRGCSADWWWF